MWSVISFAAIQVENVVSTTAGHAKFTITHPCVCVDEPCLMSCNGTEVAFGWVCQTSGVRVCHPELVCVTRTDETCA